MAPISRTVKRAPLLIHSRGYISSKRIELETIQKGQKERDRNRALRHSLNLMWVPVDLLQCQAAHFARANIQDHRPHQLWRLREMIVKKTALRLMSARNEIDNLQRENLRLKESVATLEKEKTIQDLKNIMSVEGLLSEVQHFNVHKLDVAYGEQLYYGGKRVFSDVQPGSSAGEKGEHKGHGKSELKGAVKCAKKTCEKALNSQGGNSMGLYRVSEQNVGFSNCEVIKLREQQSALEKKVTDLAKLVADLQLELSTRHQGETSATNPAIAETKKKTSNLQALTSYFGKKKREKKEDIGSKYHREPSALENKVADLAELVADLQVELSTHQRQTSTAKPAAAPADPVKDQAAAGDDNDFDLFDSEEEEDDEKAKIVKERLAANAEKKSKKAGPIAKSSVILDVKPWGDETDLGEMEMLVRSIEMDGLYWGDGEFLSIEYGIQKLRIITIIEDLKVSADDLIEKITGDFEDHVQSVDIVAFYNM